MVRNLWLLMFCLVSLAGAAHGQNTRSPNRGSGDRTALEQRFRERLLSVLRERLALTEEQAQKLGQVHARFDDRRREMFTTEREVRLGMRRALQADSSGSNDEVAALLDRALRLERQRVELMEAEQRELSPFLTPIQRAKYYGFQEQLRRRMDEMRGGPGAPVDTNGRFAPGGRRRPPRPPERQRPESP